jgi:formyl-CoA transferase
MDMMPRVNYPAPTLGQHNEEILKGFIGLSDEEFAELAEKKVI